jgi:monomeric sarcosine oxidase
VRRPHVDVAVIGLGLAGSAAARAVARRGRSVAAFEAYAPGHRKGSSHGRSRIFRRAYDDPFYVELTGRAGRLWMELAETTGEPVFRLTGEVDLWPDTQRLADALADGGVPMELVPGPVAEKRWPLFRFEEPVVYHPEAGVVDPDLAIAVMVRGAVAAGAAVAYNTPVTALEPEDAGVRVRAGSVEYFAGTVIVAAGPWLAPLLGSLVDLPPLAVTQQQVFFFRPRDPRAVWPNFIIDDIYGLAEGDLVKVAEHRRGTPTTAGERSGVIDAASRERITAFVQDRVPGLDPAPVGALSCLYTSTPDEDFILDRSGPFVVCSPCSGHGAKFAPLVGELAADLAEELPENQGPALPRFALSRFG